MNAAALLFVSKTKGWIWPLELASPRGLYGADLWPLSAQRIHFCFFGENKSPL